MASRFSVGIVGCALCAGLAGAGSAIARAGTVLRHQLTPGSVTVYRLQLETVHRLGPRVQREVWTGSLTRMLFHEEEPGTATCVQMLALRSADAAEPATATRPGPAEVQRAEASPPDWVRLTIAKVDIEQAPFIVPGQTAWSRQVLSSVIEVTDWPDEALSAGDSWQRPFRAGPIEATQHCELKAVDQAGTDMRATLVIRTVPAAATDSAARRLVSATSTLSWSARDRELLLLEGQAVTREAGEAGEWEVTRTVVLSRVGRSRTSGRQLEVEREAIIQLGQAVSAYQREDYGHAARTLRVFTRRWPRSRWQPVADYLSGRIETERLSQEPLPTSELQAALTKLLATWNQAEADGDVEEQARCRSSLAHLAGVNRPEMVRLLDAPEAPLRSLACFALAFGAAPADVALLQEACEDDEADVRRTALYALAIRASPLTSVETLLRCLADGDAGVRQQACEAIGACVEEDSPRIADVRSGLLGCLVDDSAQMVLAAARALLRVGSPAEIEQVRRTAETAGSSDLRDALRGIIGEDPASAPPAP